MRTASMLLCLSACAIGCGGPTPSELRTTNAGDLQVSYLERRGDGPLVVLLHGFPDTARTWDRLSEQLSAQGYRTVAPFLRGYPPTALPTSDTTIIQLGRDVIALLDALGAQQAILIGHDWGATAAYAAANLMPARVTKLVTVAIPHPLALALHPEVISESPHFVAFARQDAPANFRANNFAQLDATLALWSPRWSFPANELAELKATLAMPGATEATLGYYRAFASTEPDPVIFNRTTVPTLTLYGTMDGAGSSAPFADQQAGFTLPVEVVPMPSGHFVHREREQEVSAEVLQFLRQ